MSGNKNRQWILNTRPSGYLTGNEFRWNEASIPKPTDRQVLVRNLWLSFDPTQRGWMARDSYVPMIPLGELMRAGGVGQVIESLHSEDQIPERTPMIAACICIILSQYRSRRRINDYQKRHLTRYLPGP
jgi:NADPH-dependent curcumin reductase CurA